MLKFILILNVVHVTFSSVSQHDPFYCYSSDPIRPQVGMFATKSSYETNRGRSIDPNVSACTPAKFWLLSRHGTRLPSRGDITGILNNYERLHRDVSVNYNAGRTSLCASDFNLLQNWSFDTNITLDKEQYLTVSGWNELEGLGRRYSEAFPTLLPRNYSRNDFLFRPTYKQRTQASLKAFADGIFGHDGHIQVQFEEVPDPDFFLRPHDNCELYDEVIANKIEQDAFRDGPDFQQMLTQVSQKLGFHGSRQLRENEIDTIANLCKFEQIWFLDEPSPWCVAFSISNHAVLEYLEDLDYFWRVGYGYRDFRTLFENMNCYLMQDLLNFVTSNNPNDHLARIYSTHSTILQLIIVTLGVFEDEVQLTRHNFAQQTFRQWKSSLIAPMGTNLAVIKYSCADGDDDLLFLFNEKPLHINGCQPNGLCKQSLIVERFSHFMNGDCRQIFCSNNNRR
ncbi:hypothetical protein PVAND_002941 [Polypedilum vanderplanki]|uniref:Multiple inositol polyphosphate phosphatase 1 n=1 Tax=Polypedilum vanderplanki TaxID=319348 RepID=A0A9J6BSK7_POLVA|nr:hypothetical protein PVAND_002941 [Polypedilum vanderplanki]